MKKHFLSFLVLSLLAPIAVMAEQPFAFALFERVQQANNENIIISPYSIEQAIGMTANGATGDALTEILAVNGEASLAALNQHNSRKTDSISMYQQDTCTHFFSANSVWYKPGISLLQPFCNSVRLHYNAQIASADFATQEGIDLVNNWVDTQTHHLIPVLYQETQPEKELAIINATLFEGMWHWSEGAGDMGPRPFRNANGSGTMVPMVGMSRSTRMFYVSDQFAALRINFEAEEYLSSPAYVLFIMPRDPEHPAPLTAEAWETLMQNPRRAEVVAQIPMFDVTCNQNMLSTLQEMGAFIHNNFTAIATSPMLVTNVTHIARMKMDEKGMAAAAVTEIGMESGMPNEQEPPIEFVVDRPFFAAIMSEGVSEPIFLARINSLEGEACEAPAPLIFTGLNELDAAPSSSLLLRDGHILIQRGNATYSITGARVK